MRVLHGPAGDPIPHSWRAADVTWRRDSCGLRLDFDPDFGPPGSARAALPVASLAALQPPSVALLAGLHAQVDLGHYRGVVQQLDRIGAAEPACAGFVEHMRVLARDFQFDSMLRLIGEVRDARAA